MIIAIFDSGVGGLWILKHLRKELPKYDYIYFSDQAHVPYGPKTSNEIRNFSKEITEFLIKQNCQLIIIACNTASAISLNYLRQEFPETKFIGMEPAIKPATETTKTGKIGVLATQITLQGELYNSVVKKLDQHIKIFEDTCSGLVEQIEKGELKSKKTELILEKILNPMVKKNIDTVVLGCTHYPFVMPLIRKIIGNKINIIDPTEAIIRQVDRVVKNDIFKNNTTSNSELTIYTTGDTNNLEHFLIKILNKDIKVKKINWNNKLKLNI